MKRNKSSAYRESAESEGVRTISLETFSMEDLFIVSTCERGLLADRLAERLALRAERGRLRPDRLARRLALCVGSRKGRCPLRSGAFQKEGVDPAGSETFKKQQRVNTRYELAGIFCVLRCVV